MCGVYRNMIAVVLRSLNCYSVYRDPDSWNIGIFLQGTSTKINKNIAGLTHSTLSSHLLRQIKFIFDQVKLNDNTRCFQCLHLSQ